MRVQHATVWRLVIHDPVLGIRRHERRGDGAVPVAVLVLVAVCARTHGTSVARADEDEMRPGRVLVGSTTHRDRTPLSPTLTDYKEAPCQKTMLLS